VRSDSDLCVVVHAKTASRQSAVLKLDRRVVLPTNPPAANAPQRESDHRAIVSAKTAGRQRSPGVRVDVAAFY